MKNENLQNLTQAPGAGNEGLVRRAIQIAAQFIFLAAVLFLTAGTPRWPWAWVYLAAGGVLVLANFALLPRELIEERAGAKSDARPWDRKVTGAIAAGTIAAFVVAGLDYRFEWTPAFPDWLRVTALAAWAAGQALFTWAMTSNRNFSTRVRMQQERGHQVSAGGPYQYVRHPGYVGAIVFTSAVPLILGSWWALIPALVAAALFVLRTALEDRMLQDELSGYRDYAQKTRFRLLPGVW